MNKAARGQKLTGNQEFWVIPENTNNWEGCSEGWWLTEYSATIKNGTSAFKNLRNSYGIMFIDEREI